MGGFALFGRKPAFPKAANEEATFQISTCLETGRWKFLRLNSILTSYAYKAMTLFLQNDYESTV